MSNVGAKSTQTTNLKINANSKNVTSNSTNNNSNIKNSSKTSSNCSKNNNNTSNNSNSNASTMPIKLASSLTLTPKPTKSSLDPLRKQASMESPRPSPRTFTPRNKIRRHSVDVPSGASLLRSKSSLSSSTKLNGSQNNVSNGDHSSSSSSSSPSSLVTEPKSILKHSKVRRSSIAFGDLPHSAEYELIMSALLTAKVSQDMKTPQSAAFGSGLGSPSKTMKGKGSPLEDSVISEEENDDEDSDNNDSGRSVDGDRSDKAILDGCKYRCPSLNGEGKKVTFKDQVV